MILDRSHFPWAWTSVTVTLIAVIPYWIYAQSAPNGPSGGSWQGMLFGIAGTGCMIYAGLLAGRKKVPQWQIGSSQAWMRGHIWIGLLSVPLILCHCGFRWGGPLEQCLMATFAIVILSGIYGLAIQQFLPRSMSLNVSAQAIAPQIHVACEKLRQSTELKVQAKCDRVFLESLSIMNRRIKASQATAPQLGLDPLQNRLKPFEPSEISFSPQRELATFYWEQLDTFLKSDASRTHDLANPTLATARFARLRESATEDLLPVIDELELACNERRQLLLQSSVQNWLHGWLNIHIPLSVTLLVLGLCHVVMSLYY